MADVDSLAFCVLVLSRLLAGALTPGLWRIPLITQAIGKTWFMWLFNMTIMVLTQCLHNYTTERWARPLGVQKQIVGALSCIAGVAVAESLYAC